MKSDTSRTSAIGLVLMPSGTSHVKSQGREVRILLVEDHEVVRKGLRDLIEGHSGWRVCGEAASGNEGIEKAGVLNPDVVAIDISMPGLDGIEATKRIRCLCPKAKLVVVSMYDSQKGLAAKAGADAYVGKSRTWGDLCKTIAEVLEK